MLSFLIFIASFLIRALVQYNVGAFVTPQTWEYEVAANNFLSGRGLTYDLYGTAYYSLLTPLYPLLCAVVYFISWHSFFVLLIIQAVISSSICVVIFWIGRRVFGENVGLLSAIFTAFHPGIIIYTYKLHPLVLDSLLFCVIILTLIITRENPVFINQLKLGISFGLSVLTRSTILLFLPFSWLWLKIGSKKVFLLYMLVSLLILTPWLLRNYLIYKKISIVSSSANVFWRGNNPHATGTSFALSGKPMLEEDKEMMFLIHGKTEMEQNKIFWSESFKFIKNNPIKFIQLFLKKFYYFWWFSPDSGKEYKKEWFNIYKIFYFTVLYFAIFGLFSLRQISTLSRYNASVIILFILIIAIAQSLFYVEGRHRLAVEPLLLIFTANGVICFVKKVRECLRMKI